MKFPKYTWLISASLAASIGLSACLNSDPPNSDPADGTGGAVVRDASGFRISSGGIGPIRLGMTLADAKKALPAAKFDRTSDGEGIALVDVRVGNDSLMALYADEEDPGSPVDWSKKISFIETFNAACTTPAGIKPGSSVVDAEKAYGKTKSIFLSEIESREFITFTNHPNGLTFRIDYSGIFADGSNETTQFAPGAKIFSISISQD